jgi:hypothetical protein
MQLFKKVFIGSVALPREWSRFGQSLSPAKIPDSRKTHFPDSPHTGALCGTSPASSLLKLGRRNRRSNRKRQ